MSGPPFENEFPSWYGWAEFVALGVGAAVIILGAANGQDRPLVFAGLLALSVFGWLVCAVRQVEPNSALFTGTVVGRMLPLLALQLGGNTLGTFEVHGHDQSAMLLAAWLIGETTAIGRRADIAIALIGGIAMAAGRDFVDPTYHAGPIWIVAMFIALAVGLTMRMMLTATFASKALAASAATNERQRIAREVHDVIAHSLTVTMLHLTAARLAVGRGDSAAATEALEEAEKAGRTSLSEIRNTVGLLRIDGSEPTNAPLPAAADVPALVEGYRAAGLDVSLDFQGDLSGVEPAAGLALYRIVQESLTNAGRHSPGARTTVRIEIGPPLVIDVQSDGGTTTAQAGTGMGLTGMAERAAALGGLFEAGRSGNGWRVAATLP
jgi:signal transduction histidine kinase